MFKALYHRSFALLWSGQTISRFGDQLYGIALAWWILEKTGSALAMSMLFICSFTPMILFSLIGGVTVDRFSRVRVMLASDIGRGLIITVVTLLAAVQRLEIWHVYAVSILFGFVDAFFQPAYTAAVPDITPQDALPSANAITSLSGQIIGVAGPALGAAIVLLGGTSTAFALDALTFFLSAACLVMIRTPSVARSTNADSTSSSIFREALEGISTVFQMPWLWILIALSALLNITVNGPMAVALPFLIKDNLHADVSTLGLLCAMLSLGAVIGTIWMSRAGTIRRRGPFMCGALMIAGLMVLVLGFPSPLIVAALAVLVIGASITIAALTWTHVLQERIPQELMGRVSSIDNLGSFALLPVGFGVTGWATEQVGASSVFMLGGVLTVGFVILGLLHPSIQQLD